MRFSGITILLLSVLIMSCEDDLIYSPEVSEVDVVILNLLIGADLMPFIEPDPIIILMTIQLTNLNETDAFINFQIPTANIHRAADDKLLGEIRFETNWDGLLEPAEIDTVELRKKTEKASLFSHNCNEMVYLEIKLINSLGEDKTIRTNDKQFGCYF